MSLASDYISKLRTNNFALEDKNQKKTLLDYCVNSGTANFFLGRADKEFESELDNKDFREHILLAQKKSLQHQSSLKSFLNLAKTNNIDVCLLKGAFMSNFIYPNFSMRSMRDIDLLVDEGDFLKLLNIMLSNGYIFFNSSEKKIRRFNFNYAHQAPILIDRFGIAFEIHHRLKTNSEIKNSDYLTKNLIEDKRKKILFDLPVSIPSDNFAFIHCCYHAICKSKLNIGPIFLNDLMQFENRIDNRVLEYARISNCLKEVELGIEIIKYVRGSDIPNEKQVKKAVEIIIYCYKMPEFLPRKKLNLISSIKESYSSILLKFSLKASLIYLKIKFKQTIIFLKSYSLNYSLHKKRTKFFKDFNRG